MEIKVGRVGDMVRIIFTIESEPDIRLGGYNYAPDPPEIHCFDINKEDAQFLAEKLTYTLKKMKEMKNG